MRGIYRPYLGVLAMAVVAVLSVVALATTSLAQTTTPTANSIKVSPLRTDVSVDPGENRTVKILVSNPTDAEVQVRPVQNDFIAGNERGEPAIILDENQSSESRSLKQFMQPLGNVTIPARGSATVEVQLNIPASAKPGGYYGALRFAPVAPDTGGQVNLSVSVASIILLQVRGEVEESLTLTDFTVQQNGSSKALFTTGDNLSLAIRLQNNGGVHLGPIGKISVTRGDDIVHEVDFNSGVSRDMVLPDSARRWDVPLDTIDGFGRYTVSAVFTYGAKNQSLEVIKTFWIIPIWMIITGIVVFLVIVAVIIFVTVRVSRGKAKRPARSGGLGRR